MIFFDLDGTLYRTHETCLPPLRAVCAKYGIPLGEEGERIVLHTSMDAMLDRFAPDVPQHLRERLNTELIEAENEEVRARGRLFDGAEELLRALHGAGVPLAICGMGQAEYIDTILTACGIKHYFDPILHRVEGKTKAQVLSEYLRRANLEAARCLLVGDSLNDLCAARENGMPFIGVRHGYGREDIEHSAAMVDDLRQLAAAIHDHYNSAL